MAKLEVAAYASNLMEARFLASILESAGIPVVLEGAALMDEWAVVGQMSGQLSSQIKVPAAFLEEAQRALAEAREHPLTEEDVPGSESDP